MNLVALAITLAWLLYTLYFVGHPFPGIAVDPMTSLRLTAMYTGVWTIMAAPLIALLSFAFFARWRSRRRLKHDQELPSPLTMILVAIAWIFVSLAIFSEPGPGLILGLPWLLFSVGLGLVWLVCSVMAARATFKRPALKNVVMTLAYALPIPMAAICLAMYSGAVLETRFEVSEGALSQHVEEFERTDGESMSGTEMVGLYLVGTPDRRHGCVRVTTNWEMDYYAGFAYCPDGPLPTPPNEEFDHFRDDWWRFEVHH
jgi:hypothetical protein